jgi:type 2A phosphatase activator TIP41
MLFEDELGDNGSALLNIRVRAMPSGFFILQRFFLRVDRVLVRVIDTRIYHDYSSSEIIREFSVRELDYHVLITVFIGEFMYRDYPLLLKDCLIMLS